MPSARAYACASPTAALAGTTIPRREVTDKDVRIDILFCGICHSDLHTARD
jgi:alcohol dehydrogenase (NADP+)